MIQTWPEAAKTLSMLAAVCLGAAGCTSFTQYEPSARAPSPATTVPTGQGADTGTSRNDVGVEVQRTVPSQPVIGGQPRYSEPKIARRVNAASAVLIEQSRDERAAGSYADASASIERALRIDPNNPALWIELAEIKDAEGDYDQAEMMARKALTLAGSDRSIMARAERLLDL